MSEPSKNSEGKSQDPDQTDVPQSKVELRRFFAAYHATRREEGPSELVNLLAAGTSKTADQLIRLREDAVEALDNRRRELLRTAKFEALRKLYYELAGDMGLEAEKGDARLIEIIEEMKRRNHEVARAWDENSSEREAAALRVLESVGGGLLSLPAALADVLRWAAGVPSSFPLPPLQDAFIDLLSVSSAKERHKRITIWGESDAAAWVRRYEAALASPGLPADQRAFHEAELCKYSEVLNHERALADFAERFKPGMAIPKLIEGESENTFVKYWRDAEVDERNIVFFAEQFRSFWLEHGSAYAALYEDSQREEEARTKAGRQAGFKSSEIREEARWKKFTQAFCEFSKGNEITDGLIESFPKQDDVGQARGIAFLKTLLNAVKHPELQSELMGLLKAEGIKLPERVAVRIVSECMAMLQACISSRPSGGKIVPAG